MGVTPSTGTAVTLTWATSWGTKPISCHLYPNEDNAASQVNYLSNGTTFFYDFANSSAAAALFVVGTQSPALRTASYNPATFGWYCN